MNVIALPLAEHAGTIDLPEVLVPEGMRAMRIAIARCTDEMPDVWPDASEIEVTALTADGAVLGGFTAVGGQHTHFRGTVLSASHGMLANLDGLLSVKGVVRFAAPTRTEVVYQFFA